MQSFGEPGGADRLEGVVAQWTGSWGFIDFLDGRRAYAHNSASGGSPLVEGQAVLASLVPDDRNEGKWQARDVERVATYAEDGSGRIEGTVTGWRGAYGFAHFTDGRRAYVHSSFCSQPLSDGDVIIASLVEDPQNLGKWQAQHVDKKAAMRIIDDGSGRLQGRVTQWHGTYGFIQLADGRRAYVHNSQCGAPLWEGASVLGRIAEDPKNPEKWQAFEVSVLNGAAPASAPARMPSPLPCPPAPAQPQRAAPRPQRPGRLQAQVSEWSGTFGFLQFEDGRRAYVHNSQCGGQGLAVGELVIASIVEDPRNLGKWQALEVCGASTPAPAPVVVPRPMAPRPAVTLAASFAAAARSGAAAMPAPVVAQALPMASVAQGAPGARHPGVVSQWFENGYGFADFADGRRAYVHHSATGGEHLVAGEHISAILVADRNPGKWQAREVRRCADAAEAEGSCAESAVVAEWRPQGYGFVHVQDGRRAYIHRSALPQGGDLEVGASLAVVLGEDPRNPGKWCVERIAGSPAPQERCAGVVSEWSPRGFGFATFEDGRRAYLHSSQCQGAHLDIGERIVATVVPDDRMPGKWQAQGVERCAGDSPATGALAEPASKRPRLA